MKYMILIHSNPASRAIWEGLPTDARAEGLTAYAALNEELTASGELIASEALADASQAVRVSVSEEGEATTTDGPFAEAKEQLAGFLLIECDTLERAIERAAQVPEAALGLVEVRPVRTLDELL